MLEHAGAPKIWFWRPQLYWYGWRTLIPWFHASDEHGCPTVVLGWTITGRAVLVTR